MESPPEERTSEDIKMQIMNNPNITVIKKEVSEDELTESGSEVVT